MDRQRDGWVEGRVDMSPVMEVTGPGLAFPDSRPPRPQGCSHPIAPLAPSVPTVPLTRAPPGHGSLVLCCLHPHLATQAWRLSPTRTLVTAWPRYPAPGQTR